MTETVTEIQHTLDGGLRNVAGHNNKNNAGGGALSVRQEHEGNIIAGKQCQQWMGEIPNNSDSEVGLPSRGGEFVRTDGGDLDGCSDNTKMRQIPMSMLGGNEVSGLHVNQDVLSKSYKYIGGFDSNQIK